jgi:long-chain acyl-CoA synthetase
MSGQPLLMSTGVRASARRTPDKTAIRCAGRDLSYAQLVDRMNRIGDMAETALGLAPGDRVILLVPNGPELIELSLGLADRRIIPVLLSPQVTAPELELIAADSGARAVVCPAAQRDRLGAAGLPDLAVIVTDDPGPAGYEAMLHRASPAERTPLATEDDLYAIHYTSGTTGRPKGVMLAHRCRTLHMLFVMGVNQAHYHEEVRALAVAPMFNGAGYAAALAAIWFGKTLVIQPGFDAEATLALIASERITAIFLVPTHFHAIFALPDAVLARHDVSSLRVIQSGAASLPQDTKERIVRHFGAGKLFEGYGSTEAGGITSLRPEDQLTRPGSVGRPLGPVELRLVDAQMRDVPRGEIGEIVVRSPYLFRGYWNLPDEHARAFRDGWYATGDLARQDADGFVYIAGRVKNVIVSGGQNIYPREVEDVLFSHPDIAQVALVGKPDPYWGEIAVAFVVVRPGASVTSEGLRLWARERLSPYKVPKEFRQIDRMPEGSSGKVLARALQDLL